MEKCSSVDQVRNFFKKAWQLPQNWDTTDDLLVEDFVFISSGRIERREAFKRWQRTSSRPSGTGRLR